MKDNQFDSLIGLDPQILKSQSKLNQGKSQYLPKGIGGTGSSLTEKQLIAEVDKGKIVKGRDVEGI